MILAMGEVEAAESIGISPQQLANLRRDGLVEYVQLGRRVLYQPRGLVELLKRLTRPAAPEVDA